MKIIIEIIEKRHTIIDIIEQIENNMLLYKAHNSKLIKAHNSINFSIFSIISIISVL